MWSSPVLTGANGDENGDYRHISEAIICGTVAAHLLPSFSKQNLMMLDAHEETNGFKSTLLKARNKNVSLVRRTSIFTLTPPCIIQSHMRPVDVLRKILLVLSKRGREKHSC